jgi:hypothetical protein
MFEERQQRRGLGVILKINWTRQIYWNNFFFGVAFVLIVNMGY